MSPSILVTVGLTAVALSMWHRRRRTRTAARPAPRPATGKPATQLGSARSV